MNEQISKGLLDTGLLFLFIGVVGLMWHEAFVACLLLSMGFVLASFRTAV